MRNDINAFLKVETMVLEKEEFENRPIQLIIDIAIRLCESIKCEECPVVLYNYEKRTEFEKQNLHIPCCYNLEKWIEDESRKNIKEY